MACGDGACLGCGEKTTIHLFTCTVTALMQPRVKAFVAKLDGLIDGLEKHLRMKLTESVDLSDTSAVLQAVADAQGRRPDPGQPVREPDQAPMPPSRSTRSGCAG